MELGNRLRIGFAFVLIKLVRAPWRIGERLLRRQFPLVDHYLIMRILRWIPIQFEVTIRYSNPVTVQEQPIRMHLNICENTQLAQFRMREHFDRAWIRVVGQAMKEAESFIDVGAHVGAYAVAIGQAYPDRRVVAVEPLLANYSNLEKNIRLNGLSNVQTFRAAVTEDDGPVTLYINPINEGGGSIIAPHDYLTADIRIDVIRYQARHPDFVPTEQVSGMRLDELMTGPSVVKIDVEGAEESVLQSGRVALTSGMVEVMVLEITHETIGNVIEFLDDVEFDCFDWGHRLPLTPAHKQDWRVGNILCLRRDTKMYGPILNRVAN